VTRAQAQGGGDAGELEFGLLGPLVVRQNGTELALRRGRERAVLAALLLAANRIVAVDMIAEVLWGDEPPPSAPMAVRNYIGRLRRALGQAGPQRISTHPGGYLIRMGDGELDLARFESLLASTRAAARGDSWEQAGNQAREALALWRGEPLAGVESATLKLREAPRLAELRLQAEELGLEARLRLGGHDEAAAELRRLAAVHPLREHVHALLMLALYRCSRQADALAAYQQVRTRLVEELGAEPGAELRKLHQQILGADPAPDLARHPAAAPAAGPGATTVATAQARAGDGRAATSEGGGARPGTSCGPPAVPRQLPAAVSQFTGRVAELRALSQILDEQAGRDAPGTVVLSAIGGAAGVGKTALAIHFAHQAADRFPDGHLYLNLRGFGPGGTPVAPAGAIRGFLNALGVAPERVPPSPSAQEGLYRSLLADKRMLVVLDNAADEQQVRPLIPASPGTLVIVTSRNQLGGLAAADGARLLSLDVFSHDEAAQLLAARIGADRTAAEPDAAAEMARLCGCLPLALAIIAARAAARPGFPLAALASELRDTATRLDALDTGDPGSSMRAVFSCSYQQLSPGAARVLRLMGRRHRHRRRPPSSHSPDARPLPAHRRPWRPLADSLNGAGRPRPAQPRHRSRATRRSAAGPGLVRGRAPSAACRGHPCRRIRLRHPRLAAPLGHGTLPASPRALAGMGRDPAHRAGRRDSPG